MKHLRPTDPSVVAALLVLAGCSGSDRKCIGAPGVIGGCFGSHNQPATLGGLEPASGTHLLDRSFGSSGHVTELGIRNASGQNFDAVTTDRFGRVLAAGFRATSSLVLANIVVHRYAANGDIDPTFGTDGRFEFPGELRGEGGHAITVDALDRIWVAGTLHVGINPFNTETRERATVFRLLPDGALDSDFGDAGSMTIAMANKKWNASALDLALDAFGGAVLIGRGLGSRPGATPPFEPRAFLAALTEDGELNTAFGEDGFAYEPLDRNARARAAVQDAAGRWLVAGELRGDPWQAAVWRFTPAGFPDTSFGDAGVATIEEAPLDLQAVALAIDASGRIVIAGNRASIGRDIERWPHQLFDGATNGSPVYDPVVWRLDAGGNLDPSFGSVGAATVNISSKDHGDHFDIANAMVLDAAGRILVAGTSDRPKWDGAAGFFVYSTKAILVLRFTPDGALDTSFTANGTALFSSRSARVRATAAALDDASRLLLAGSVGDTLSLWRLTL